MTTWKPVEATWKKLHADFEKKTEIHDYVVKKRKLRFFRVKKSGAKQIGKYLKRVDKAMKGNDIAGAEKSFADFQSVYGAWRNQMDKDHIAFKKLCEKMKAGEVDFTEEEFKKVQAATPAFRLLVANVANMEMTIDNALRDAKGIKPAAARVRFAGP